MAKKYFLQQYLQEQYVHGGVTNVDAEKILLADGFEPIFFPYHYDFSIKAKIGRLFFLIKELIRIKNGSVVVFLFPFYAVLHKLFIRLLRLKKVTLICYIVDIDGIKDGNKHLLKQEVRFFQKFRYFIVLNASMERWLKEQVPGSVAAPVHFHSFLTNPAIRPRDRSFHIVFAGNLAKSPFLEQLYLLKSTSPDIRFDLYGPDPTDRMIRQENVAYRGVEKPYDLPGKLNGSFGLVWEGDSIDKPEGSLGNYIQFITHNKISLYILSGLPIIIPASAGTAPLVESYQIGFAVNNLYEIEEKIQGITIEKYREMQRNLKPIAEKVSTGQFLTDAVNEIMKRLN